MIHTLRPYQSAALDETSQAFRSHRRVLLVAPTGAGKTTIAAEIIRRSVERGKRIVFLAHRKELIEQCSTRLDQFGIDHGVIMASNSRHRPNLPVQVASVQTLINRDLDAPPNLIIIDETHRCTSASYQTVINNCGNPYVLGLTATPIRADGKGLASQFDVMVQCPTVAELTELGYLVRAVSYAGKRIDLSGVRICGGDYDRDQLADWMNKPHLIGDCVTEWKRIAEGRSTMLFAAGVAHSKAIVESFREFGVKAAHLDGTTPKDERSTILARLASGSLTLVSNAMVLTEGVDVPRVDCIVLARPTKSAGLYLQMAGRGLRTFPGKSNLLLLDHGNCIRECGLISQDRNWQLLPDATGKRGKSVSYAETFKVCPDCGRVTQLTDLECECGYRFAQRGKQKNLKVYNGQLELIEEKQVRAYSESQRKAKYFRLLVDQHTGVKKDGSPFSKGYAYVKYEAMFKQRPESGWCAEWAADNPQLIQPYRVAWLLWSDLRTPEVAA
jgi:DNA repair protein RadD